MPGEYLNAHNKGLQGGYNDGLQPETLADGIAHNSQQHAAWLDVPLVTQHTSLDAFTISTYR